MAIEHKVNGSVKVGEFLGRNLQFFAIAVTSCDLTVASNLSTVVETISLNGQPIIMGGLTATALNFAIEHNGAWGIDATASKAALEAALEAALPVGAWTVTARDVL